MLAKTFTSFVNNSAINDTLRECKEDICATATAIQVCYMYKAIPMNFIVKWVVNQVFNLHVTLSIRDCIRLVNYRSKQTTMFRSTVV